MPSASALLIGMVAGVFGVGYFMYGRRQAKFAPMISGVLLCVYPYFFDNPLWLSLAGIALLAVPFVVDY